MPEKMYVLVFDDIIKNQLQKAGRDGKVREILGKFFDEMEEKRP